VPDSGSHPPDSGTHPIDSGTPPTGDSGSGANDAGTSPPPGDDGGCGCVTAPGHATSSTGGFAGLGMIAGLFGLARRRRRAARGTK
jgi:MYXO-CTERM domain-containing protein